MNFCDKTKVKNKKPINYISFENYYYKVTLI